MADARAGRRAKPGGHELDPEVLARLQRRRILDGAAEAIARHGYREATVADIVKAAAIARARFYENFASKEDCFLALYEELTRAAYEAVSDACEEQLEQGTAFPDRVRVGLAALLTHLAEDPAAARACVVEGPALGTPLGPRFEQMVDDFAALLHRGQAEAEVAELAETIEETVVGGIYWLLYYALLDGRPGQLEELLPELTGFALTPFVGAEAARAASLS